MTKKSIYLVSIHVWGYPKLVLTTRKGEHDYEEYANSKRRDISIGIDLLASDQLNGRFAQFLAQPGSRKHRESVKEWWITNKVGKV